MKGQASAIVLAILCIANAILPAISQTVPGSAKGGNAGTTSLGASALGNHVGPLSEILARVRQQTPHMNYGRGQGYHNNQNADNSFLLPWLMAGGDMGSNMMTMSMLMNSRGSKSNSVLPFLLMGQDNMWPLMFMNNNRQGRGGMGMNPATMMFAMGHELF